MPRSARLLLAVALVAGGANFLWTLGSSSLFVDEVFSWRAADSSLSTLITRVRTDEVAPPGYYLLLHGWIELFGDRVWVMRLLSALLAIALVAAVAVLAGRLAGWRAAALAGLLTSASPLVLEYGQQVRSYIAAMLAATAAVLFSLVYFDRRPYRKRWLALAAAAAVATAWLNYWGLIPVAVLCVWLASQRSMPRSHKALVLGTVGAGVAAVAPLMLEQLRAGHGDAVEAVAQLTFFNVVRVVGTPYDRLYNVFGLGEQIVAAAAILVGVVLMLAFAKPIARDRRYLFAALALAGPIAVFAVTLAADRGLESVVSEIMISRYTAVVAPFMIATFAVGLAAAPRWLGYPLAAVALLLAVGASTESHERRAFYPPTAEAMEHIGSRWRDGDLVVPQGYPALGYNLEYYARHALPPRAAVAYPGSEAARAALKYRRLWSISDQPLERVALEGILGRFGLRMVEAREVQTSLTFQVVLAERRRGAARASDR